MQPTNINLIRQFQSYIDEPSWKANGYTEEKMKEIITSSLKDIVKEFGNKQVSDILKTLSDRMSQEFNTPEGNQLAFETNAIALGLIPPDPNVKVPSLHVELWREVLAHVPPKAISERGIDIGKVSKLEASMGVSKLLQEATTQARIDWVRKNGLTMDSFGFKSAEAAVNYAIEKQLTHFYMSNISQKDLDRLIKGCPNLKVLGITMSEDVKVLPIPAGESNLQCLDCSRTNLKEIPKGYINLKVLIAAQCNKLETLPNDLTKLEILDLFLSKIKEVPKEYVNLRFLSCLGDVQVPENLQQAKNFRDEGMINRLIELITS